MKVRVRKKVRVGLDGVNVKDKVWARDRDYGMFSVQLLSQLEAKLSYVLCVLDLCVITGASLNRGWDCVALGSHRSR